MQPPFSAPATLSGVGARPVNLASRKLAVAKRAGAQPTTPQARNASIAARADLPRGSDAALCLALTKIGDLIGLRDNGFSLDRFLVRKPPSRPLPKENALCFSTADFAPPRFAGRGDRHPQAEIPRAECPASHPYTKQPTAIAAVNNEPVNRPITPADEAWLSSAHSSRYMSPVPWRPFHCPPERSRPNPLNASGCKSSSPAAGWQRRVSRGRDEGTACWGSSQATTCHRLHWARLHPAVPRSFRGDGWAAAAGSRGEIAELDERGVTRNGALFEALAQSTQLA